MSPVYPGFLIHRFNQSRVKNIILPFTTADSPTRVENTNSFRSTVGWISGYKGPVVESKAVHRFSTVGAVALTDERKNRGGERRGEERGRRKDTPPDNRFPDGGRARVPPQLSGGVGRNPDGALRGW